MSNLPRSLAPAYAQCVRLARSHYENFPVASRLLPARMRPHVAAVYAFARYADDIADEGSRSPAERRRLLDEWQRRLHAVVAKPSATVDDAVTDTNDGFVFAALGHTIQSCRLTVSPFDDLLSAFRQDISVTRYRTWDELLDYCRRSANPIGRIVLRIAGTDDPTTDRAADCVCSALQVTNFLQDFDRDWRSGRLYVPTEIWRSCGAGEDELGGGRLPPSWRRALAEVARRTRLLYDEGRTVSDAVHGRLRLELRATWLGGRRILRRLERAGYDPVVRRPVLGLADYPVILWQTLTWHTPPGDRKVLTRSDP